jgi:hypothetical protein
MERFINDDAGSGGRTMRLDWTGDSDCGAHEQ